MSPFARLASPTGCHDRPSGDVQTFAAVLADPAATKPGPPAVSARILTSAGKSWARSQSFPSRDQYAALLPTYGSSPTRTYPPTPCATPTMLVTSPIPVGSPAFQWIASVAAGFGEGLADGALLGLGEGARASLASEAGGGVWGGADTRCRGGGALPAATSVTVAGAAQPSGMVAARSQPSSRSMNPSDRLLAWRDVIAVRLETVWASMCVGMAPLGLDTRHHRSGSSLT